MHEPRHQPPFTSRKQDLVPIGWPKSPLGCLLASPCYLPTWRYDGVQLDTFNFALTISPGNRTTQPYMKGLFLSSATRVYTRLRLVTAKRVVSCLGGRDLPLIRNACIFLRSDPGQRELIAIEAARMSATASLYRRKQEVHPV